MELALEKDNQLTNSERLIGFRDSRDEKKTNYQVNDKINTNKHFMEIESLRLIALRLREKCNMK